MRRILWDAPQAGRAKLNEADAEGKDLTSVFEDEDEDENE
jgi:hypothetical protein